MIKIQPESSFAEHYRAVVLGIRAALTKLLLSVGANPMKPQDIARRFHLNKNLTWMVSKVVNTPDLYAIAPHVPGPARIDALLEAMKRAGAPEAAIADVRAAIDAFEAMVEKHTGDRATLELMIAELSPEGVRAEQQLYSRKLAFQGLSGILGARVRLRLACYVLAPNGEHPDMVDLVEISGLVGFRRLREDARWLLFRRQRWTDDAPEPTGLGEQPLIADCMAEGLPLVPEFCSIPVPVVDVVREGPEAQLELPPGPVGRTAALDLVYSVIARRVGSAFRDEHNRHCELGCSLTTPAELLLFDVLVHQALAWQPEMSLYSRMDGDPLHVTLKRERNRLPLVEPLQDLGRGTAGLITSHMPAYADLVQLVFARTGWNAPEFQAFRLLQEYPPIPAIALFRAELPERR